ncbi:MAG TPA: LLM class flavin-dependent oxidoreductase [Micromonosporaceae bacterium]|nr:LLM class flavin-dependent oxidoreductase [Micromonosporaceae bacterium]
MRTQIGVLLPTRELAMTGRYDLAPVLDFARQAEAAGFDSVWTGDSPLARPRLDPLVVLSAVAAVTTEVTIGTAALTATLRPPVLGAAMVASLDHAAPGRLQLALGSGFPIPDTQREFAACGVPFSERVGRLDETVRLWRQAWGAGGEAGAPARFEGRYWSIEDLDRLAPPATPGGPPLWLAASDAPGAVERTARLYDGWLPFVPTPEAYAAAWGEIQRRAAAHGRPADAIVPGMYATVTVNADRDRAEAELEEYLKHYYGRPLAVMSTVQAYCYGTAEQCAAWLSRYVQAGARHLVVRIGSLDPAAQLKTVAEEVCPAV